MQGTYLEQLKDDYDAAYIHNAAIVQQLKKKQEYSSVLLERFHVARNAYREAMEAHDLRSKKDRLLTELEWGHIVEKEEVRYSLAFFENLAFFNKFILGTGGCISQGRYGRSKDRRGPNRAEECPGKSFPSFLNPIVNLIV